jgi:acyl-CoA thioester hydrolase
MLRAETVVKVEFHDLDPMQVVWHGHYARFLESARAELMGLIDYNYPQMVASGYAWPIVDMRIKYVKPLRFAQKVRIVAELKEYEFRLRIAYRLSDAATGERTTKAETVQLPVEIATGELVFGSPPALLERLRKVLG